MLNKPAIVVTSILLVALCALVEETGKVHLKQQRVAQSITPIIEGGHVH